jgi:HlyD family secretion protein
MSPKSRLPLVMLAAAFLLPTGAGCDKSSTQAGSSTGNEASAAATADGDQDRAVRVRVVKAAHHESTRRVTVSGNILPNRKVTVSPRLPGTIVRITKDEGDTVSEGEVLVQLDPLDIELAVKQAQAGVATARAAVGQAKTAHNGALTGYRRAKKLFERKALAEAELEKAEMGRDMAAAAVATAKANASMAAAGLDVAKSKLAQLTVRASMAGTVLKRLVDEGEEARPMPPTIVLVVGETDPARVEGGVSELELRHLAAGMKVDVRVDAWPGRVFEGKLDRIGAMVDPIARTIPVRILIPNPKGELRPGMAAHLDIEVEKRRVLAIPRSALLSSDAEMGRLFTVDGEEARHRTVRLGPVFGDLVEILKGIEPGEAVVSVGQQKLKAGARVEIDSTPRPPRNAPAGAKGKADRAESKGAK